MFNPDAACCATELEVKQAWWRQVRGWLGEAGGGSVGWGIEGGGVGSPLKRKEGKRTGDEPTVSLVSVESDSSYRTEPSLRSGNSQLDVLCTFFKKNKK